MIASLECIAGFVCQRLNTISTNLLPVCPEGYYCPLGTLTLDET